LTGSSYEIVFSSVGDETVYTVMRDGTPTTLTDQPYRSGGAIEIDGQSVTINGDPAEGDRFTLDPSTRSLDIFEALDRLIGALGGTRDSDETGGAKIMQAVNSGLRDVDAVIRHVQATRAQAGAMLTRLDAMDERAADRKLAAVTVQSDAEDVDMVESISAFQSQQTGYQAALQSYASVQRMSLFDYLK
jgi:flagellar hook-associated protein 3 FlgL